MTDLKTSLKPLLIPAICTELAFVLGYLLAQPIGLGGFVIIVGVLLVLCIPLLIRCHYPFMLLAWNMGAVVFFLPGGMSLWMVAVATSFVISFTHRILDKDVQSVSVPHLTYPLIALAVVVIATAELRGGFGFHSFGGDNMGGRRYVEILLAILGYFALTARTIPKERVSRYLILFFLSGVVCAISVLYGRISNLFNFIFLFIPPTIAGGAGESLNFGSPSMSAFRPFATAGGVVFAYLLARYGIRHMLTPGCKRYFLLLCGVFLVSTLSGSRLALVTMAFTFALQFWLEGLFRTKLVLYFGLLFLLLASLTVMFAAKLPLPVQRTLTVLPVEVDPIVRADAEGSSTWRREIWQVIIPQIPQYLFLGKGYAISETDFNFMTDSAFAVRGADELAATIAGDYHNGPLSVVMPLGIWGVITFLWLLGAGFHVLLQNFRHGDSHLRIINTYLLTSYLVSIITFTFVFGGLYSGLVGFTGIFGLSVALNGGVARQSTDQAIAQSVSLES